MRALSMTALAAAALVAVFAAHPSAQQRRGDIGLTVFGDPDFRGGSATFREDVPDLRAFRLNDQISSLEVGRGETWEVCENVNFGGRCRVVSGSEADLARFGWNDTISSARRVRDERPGNGIGRGRGRGFDPGPRQGVELYAGLDYSGQRFAAIDAISNLNDVRFNDRALSLRLARGEAWEVCADANFRNCRIVNDDVDDLSQIGLSTRISSLRPAGRQGDFGRPRFGQTRLLLYDQRNFRGQPFVVTDTQTDLRAFAGRAESARVEGGGTWQLCADERFRGRCTVLSGDESDLGRLGLRNNVNSARPVRN